MRIHSMRYYDFITGKGSGKIAAKRATGLEGSNSSRHTHEELGARRAAGKLSRM